MSVSQSAEAAGDAVIIGDDGIPPINAENEENGDNSGESKNSSSSPLVAEEQENGDAQNADSDENYAAESPKKNSQNDNNDKGNATGGEEQAVPVSDDEDGETGQQFQQQGDGQYAQFEEQQYDENAAMVAAEEEIDEITIAREISNYMHVNRVNVGELDNLIDMWGLCDAISAVHSGLPDSLLKEAFNLVLEGLYGSTANSWMRKHLDHLQRMWKKEMLSHKSTARPTKFVSSFRIVYSPTHEEQEGDQGQIEGEQVGEQQPPAVDTQKGKEAAEGTDGKEGGMKQDRASLAKQRRQRKQAARRKKALATIMGVGQILEHARRKFATEDGELDIDEDDHGNFKIGGMELSFETWGQLNKIKDDGIVHAGGDAAMPKRRKKTAQNGANVAKQLLGTTSAPQPPNFSIGTPPPSMQQHQPSMAEQYPTVGEVEMPMEPAKGGKKGGRKGKAKQAKPAKTDKDEGEISSSDGDKPTSSSEESSSEEEGGRPPKRPIQPIRAQERRKVRREEERQQGASSAQNMQALLRKCFDLRGKIASKLSLPQKAMFMDLLKQSKAGALQQGQQHLQQHQALAHLLGAFQQRQL